MPKPTLHTIPEYSVLEAAQNGKCFYCNRSIKKHKTKDHFFPKSWGHSTIGNVVLCCKECNSGKNDDPPTVEEIIRFVELYKRLRWRTAVDCSMLVSMYRKIYGAF